MNAFLYNNVMMENGNTYYIYVFAHPSDPEIVKLGYTGNIEKRIKQLNVGFYRVEDFYYCYSTYEVAHERLDLILFDLIKSLDSTLRIDPNKEFFTMTPEKAFGILNDIAIISDTCDKLVLYDNSIEEKEGENESTEFSSGRAESNQSEKLGRDNAIYLLKKLGYDINNYIIYGSKSSSQNCYWLDAPKKILNENWSMILDDYLNNSLYLFNIGKNKIKESQVRVRTDKKKPNYMTLDILYNDKSFTNKYRDVNGQQLKFNDYFIAQAKYESSDIIYKRQDNIVDVTPNNTLFDENFIAEERTETHTFEEKFSPINCIPVSVSFNGKTSTTTKFKDFVPSAINLFLDYNYKTRDKILELAHQKSPLYGGKKIYLSDDPSDITEIPTKIEKLDIYYEANLSGTLAVRFVRWLAEKIGIDPSLCSYQIKK